MPTRRWPGNGSDGLVTTIFNALNLSSRLQQIDASSGTISLIHQLVLSPYIGSIIPNLINDTVPAPLTSIVRSDSASQVISTAKQLRGLVFVNYSSTKLYLRIHGTSPAPAAAIEPEYPAIPVSQDQVFIADQSLLGYDGFGYNAYTIQVSTTQAGYTPTAATAGLWSLIARFK